MIEKVKIKRFLWRHLFNENDI